MKKTNQNTKMAKVLAATLFGVGFVTPLMFSNITEASATFDKGGIGMMISKKEIENANKSTGATYGTRWGQSHDETTTTPSASNSVVITDKNGGTHLFKIVAASGSGKDAVLTLWSYDDSFGTITKFGTTNEYSTSTLKSAAEALATPVTGLLSNLTLIPYSSKSGDDTSISGKYVFIPSKTEVGDGGTWRFSSTDIEAAAQRSFAALDTSWLRSPDGTSNAWIVIAGIPMTMDSITADMTLRPALQIKNQGPCVFSTKMYYYENGEFCKGNSDDNDASYALNSSAVKPTFDPATGGVILDGLKIKIAIDTSGVPTGYKAAALLTEEADSNKNDTWAHLNGNESTAPTSAKGIMYMALVDSSSKELNFNTVDAGYEFSLKIFGLKTADTTVTELADNVVQGLSVAMGASRTLHIKVKDGTMDGINNGVAVTLKNGAVVDLAGDASNAITLDSSGTDKTGKLNLGTSTYTHSGTIAIEASGILTVEGKGTLAGTISGAGKIVIDGTVSADADKFTQTGGLEVASTKTLTLTGTSKTLGKTVSGAGKIVINGTVSADADKFIQEGGLEVVSTKTLTLTGTSKTLGKTVSGAGKVVIDGTISADADKFTQTGGLEVVSAKTLTLTGTDKTLGQTVSGAGKVVIDGTINADASKFTQNGGLEVKDSGDVLNLTAGTLSKDVTNNGTVKTNGNVTISSKLNGSTGGKLVVESGKLIYTNTTAGSITNNVEIKAGAVMDPDAGVFANGTTVTNYGTLEITGGTLEATIDGKGGDNLVMKGQMGIGAGSVKQVAGSNITVAASLIEAEKNDPDKAMFTGVDAAAKLDVRAGNLSITGQPKDNKYYVLIAGTAINGGTVKEDTIWKLENIQFPDILLADYEIKYDTNTVDNPGSIALHVKTAVTKDEGNAPGLAGVQQGAITVSKEFTDDVEKHLGLISRPPVKEKDKVKVRNVASTAKDDYKVEVVEQGKVEEIMPVQVAEKDKYDKEVWASYIRTKETTEGMKLGAGLKGDNTAQYNGTVVGVDFYTSKKAITGVALSYITGNIDGHSKNEISTINKSKYYGVSFYDRVTNGNTALIYDIGFIHGDNDISQFYTGKETTSDAKTNTYTAGARWEAAIETGRSKIVPFAAFRYIRQYSKDYTNSHNTRFETNNQNLYIPKVGIAWTGDFIMPKSVWTWRPSVEAGYVWNLGDRTADSNVLMGTRPAAIEYDTVDKSSYYAKLGMEFMCKNFTAGLFYRYLKGDKVRNNKWNVNVSWAF